MGSIWHTQSDNDNAKVKVSDEYSRKDLEAGTPRTDFLIIDKKTGEKAHYSADGETGKVTERHGFKAQGKSKK